VTPERADGGLRLRRLAVLGFGLLGGSVAWGARMRGVAAEVVGCGRRAGPLRRAQERGLIDRFATDAREAVAGAELVVLATPVGAMVGLLRAAAPGLAPDAVVTDVGSVKGPLAETLPGLLPPGVAYVGSHPMAGSHERGAEHARPDLFEGSPCVVGAEPGVAPEAAERVCRLWRALGARVVRRDPASHDREVAWTSHVPHALAFAFARALADAPAGARETVGPGFRDFTRIARSDPELWADILVANGKTLAGPLRRAGERLAELTRAIEAGDAEGVERWLAEARAALSRMDERPSEHSARSGGDKPGNPGRGVPAAPKGVRRESHE
jgi:prephenate dehydrogenase